VRGHSLLSVPALTASRLAYPPFAMDLDQMPLKRHVAAQTIRGLHHSQELQVSSRIEIKQRLEAVMVNLTQRLGGKRQLFALLTKLEV